MYVVIGVDVVQADHLMARLKEPLGEVKANKARRTGNEDFQFVVD